MKPQLIALSVVRSGHITNASKSKHQRAEQIGTGGLAAKFYAFWPSAGACSIAIPSAEAVRLELLDRNNTDRRRPYPLQP